MCIGLGGNIDMYLEEMSSLLELLSGDYNINLLNPLTPRRTQVSPFTEISILF